MTGKTTIRLAVSAENVGAPAGKQALAQAAEVLRAGGTVAFPTETVYGLGANAFDAQAVEAIFLAKQRPAWDPLIVHVADAAMLERVVSSIPARAQRLIEKFWPGPLTLLLPKGDHISLAVTAGRPLVAVRTPAHPVAHALIAAADLPLAAPSANRFGHTSPTTATHVLDDLDGRIDLLLDGGPTWCGVESTVLEAGEESVLLYRPGAVSIAEIERFAGPVVVYQPPVRCDDSRKMNLSPEALPSPGVGMRHYAPKARVIPVDVGLRSELAQHEIWLHAVSEQSSQSFRVGVMLPTGWPLPEAFSGVRYDWGSWQCDRELAQRLFAGLRALDAMGASVIVCPLPSADGLGAAIQDRLLKAAPDA